MGISETRRPGSDETSSKDFTYYCSGTTNGYHVKGVAIGVSSRLQPSVVEVTPVDERIMRLRLKHSLGFMLLLLYMLLPRYVKLKGSQKVSKYEEN